MAALGLPVSSLVYRCLRRVLLHTTELSLPAVSASPARPWLPPQTPPGRTLSHRHERHPAMESALVGAASSADNALDIPLAAAGGFRALEEFAGIAHQLWKETRHVPLCRMGHNIAGSQDMTYTPPQTHCSERTRTATRIWPPLPRPRPGTRLDKTGNLDDNNQTGLVVGSSLGSRTNRQGPRFYSGPAKPGHPCQVTASLSAVDSFDSV